MIHLIGNTRFYRDTLYNKMEMAASVRAIFFCGVRTNWPPTSK